MLNFILYCIKKESANGLIGAGKSVIGLDLTSHVFTMLIHANHAIWAI